MNRPTCETCKHWGYDFEKNESTDFKLCMALSGNIIDMVDVYSGTCDEFGVDTSKHFVCSEHQLFSQWIELYDVDDEKGHRYE